MWTIAANVTASTLLTTSMHMISRGELQTNMSQTLALWSQFESPTGGWNNSVDSVWSSLSCSIVGTIFLCASSKGIFPLELTCFSLHFSKTLLDENINWGLVCAHMHSIAQTKKILTFISLTGGCQQQKHTQHALSTKTECDYLNGWIKKTHKKTVTYQKISPKMVNPEI